MGKALQMRRRAASAPKPADGPSARADAVVRRHLELEARSFEDEVSSNPDVIDLRSLAPQFPAGLHVSPFRDDQGRLVIVRIDAAGRLASMWPVAAIAETLPFSADTAVRRLPPALTTDAGQLEDFAFHNAKDPALDDPHLTRCSARSAVFVCPWKGSLHPDAVMLAVTDMMGCAHALVEVDPAGSAAGLHWPLRFLGELRDARSGVAQQPFAYFDGERAS